MHRPPCSAPAACAAALLALLLGPGLRADALTTAAGPAEPPSLAPADGVPAEEPPFPPAAVEGEAPTPPADAPAPGPTPADATGDAAVGNTPPYLQPPPAAPEPGPRAPLLPVPETVKHARGFALVGSQAPLALLWGGGTATVGVLAMTALLASPQLPLLPFGLAIALAPLATALGGAALSLAVALAVPPLVDAVFDPPGPDGSLARLALWYSSYAGLIAAVAGVPLTIPTLLAATGYNGRDGLDTLFGYALLASLLPALLAPMAVLEAANQAGYQADLPQWCWYALEFCSLGAYAVW